MSCSGEVYLEQEEEEQQPITPPKRRRRNEDDDENGGLGRAADVCLFSFCLRRIFVSLIFFLLTSGSLGSYSLDSAKYSTKTETLLKRNL